LSLKDTSEGRGPAALELTWRAKAKAANPDDEVTLFTLRKIVGPARAATQVPLPRAPPYRARTEALGWLLVA
jgi:hypothetical protein